MYSSIDHIDDRSVCNCHVYNVYHVSHRHVSHVRAQNTEYLNIASHKQRLVRVFSHGDDKLHVAISAAQLCLVESPHQPQPSKQVPPQPGLGVKNGHPHPHLHLSGAQSDPGGTGGHGHLVPLQGVMSLLIPCNLHSREPLTFAFNRCFNRINI